MSDLSDCPKRMTYGPCGGVTADLGCEVDGRPCPFCRQPGPITWSGDTPRAPQPTRVPTVLVDFRPDPTARRDVERAADILRGPGVAVLIGEHVDDPTRHPPSVVAAAIADADLDHVVTITCRDRSRDELAAEIDACLPAEPVAIHCVTGDHPAARLGLDRPVRFELDGTALAALARDRGAVVSIAESPASPPTEWRPPRLLSKQRAGADLALLNHSGGAGDLIEFADRAGALGVTMPMVAPVPVITDRRSAAALARFPGLALPAGSAERILSSRDPHRAGIALAVELATTLLASGRFAGVNLSGSGADAGLCERAEIMAEIAEELT